MDWYLGSNIDDFVVPKDQELYDRLPSPESWWKWGIKTSEDSEFCNRRFGLDAKWNEEQLNCNGQIPSSQVDMDCFLTAKDLSSCSSINDRLLDESIHQSDLSCDQSVDQLDGLAGIEQMDEIFLSSFLEDLPGAYQRSLNFSSKSQTGTVRRENFLEDKAVDSQSISSDSQNMRSSKHLKAQPSTPSLGWEQGGVDAASQFILCSRDQSNWPQVKEKSSVRQHSYTDRTPDEETSIEETVLLQLEMVLTQPQINGFPNCSSFRGDAEVPIFAHGFQRATAKPD
ncbi:hypothetical protein Tsubulata_036385 [Turnera subulata]|uniref:Uncharacterized protein n=1 Tax=Turnera subulata TaxID=218843 RepID=A0A9Q0EXQ1_9ROSI|nr:hypothetical protein Tsubulata_036385 [Turnera subulata]